jgi:hypothetical protein
MEIDSATGPKHLISGKFKFGCFPFVRLIGSYMFIFSVCKRDTMPGARVKTRDKIIQPFDMASLKVKGIPAQR